MLPPGYIENKYKKTNNLNSAPKRDAVGFSNAMCKMNSLINARRFDEAREMLKIIKEYGVSTERWSLKIDSAEAKYIVNEKLRRGKIQLTTLRKKGYSEEQIFEMSLSLPNLKFALETEAKANEQEDLQNNKDKQLIKNAKVKPINQKQLYK